MSDYPLNRRILDVPCKVYTASGGTTGRLTTSASLFKLESRISLEEPVWKVELSPSMMAVVQEREHDLSLLRAPPSYPKLVSEVLMADLYSESVRLGCAILDTCVYDRAILLE